MPFYLQNNQISSTWNLKPSATKGLDKGSFFKNCFHATVLYRNSTAPKTAAPSSTHTYTHTFTKMLPQIFKCDSIFSLQRRFASDVCLFCFGFLFFCGEVFVACVLHLIDTILLFSDSKVESSCLTVGMYKGKKKEFKLGLPKNKQTNKHLGTLVTMVVCDTPTHQNW